MELIGVRKDTKETLDRIKSPGQSYDGAIREILQKQENKVKA